MKLKLTPLISGTLALLISTTPVSVVAQIPEAAIEEILDASEIEITPRQQQQITQLISQTRTQIQTIISSPQLNLFQTTLKEGEGFLAALKKMNLSESQKKQLETLLDSFIKQFSQIISPQQRRQFWQNLVSKWEEELEITSQQKEEITQLFWQSLDRFKNTITTQQFLQFKTTLEQTKNLKLAIENMKLSESQKQQLRGVWQSFSTQFEDIITLEQRLQIWLNLLYWWERINSYEFWFPDITNPNYS